MYNKLTCLFGHHDYSEELTEDKDGCRGYFCKVCKRNSYYAWGGGSTRWNDYDKDGNLAHIKWSDGLEVWYTWSRQISHIRYTAGREEWYDEKGNVTRRKGENNK